jgi:phage regulator Rha-like protein
MKLHQCPLTERLKAEARLRWYCESETYLDAQGNALEQYRLDRDTTLTLVTGYDPSAWMRIIKRWQELESNAQPASVGDALVAMAVAFRNNERRIAALQHEQHETGAQIEALMNGAGDE